MGTSFLQTYSVLSGVSPLNPHPEDFTTDISPEFLRKRLKLDAFPTLFKGKNESEASRKVLPKTSPIQVKTEEKGFFFCPQISQVCKLTRIIKSTNTNLGIATVPTDKSSRAATSQSLSKSPQNKPHITVTKNTMDHVGHSDNTPFNELAMESQALIRHPIQVNNRENTDSSSPQFSKNCDLTKSIESTDPKSDTAPMPTKKSSPAATSQTSSKPPKITLVVSDIKVARNIMDNVGLSGNVPFDMLAKDSQAAVGHRLQQILGIVAGGSLVPLISNTLDDSDVKKLASMRGLLTVSSGESVKEEPLGEMAAEDPNIGTEFEDIDPNIGNLCDSGQMFTETLKGNESKWKDKYQQSMRGLLTDSSGENIKEEPLGDMSAEGESIRAELQDIELNTGNLLKPIQTITETLKDNESKWRGKTLPLTEGSWFHSNYIYCVDSNSYISRGDTRWKPSNGPAAEATGHN